MEPAFGVVRVDEPQTTNLRNLLMRWCKLIALEAATARKRGAASALVEDYLLGAIEATSESAVLDASTIALWILKGDLVYQIAKLMAQPPEKSELPPESFDDKGTLLRDVIFDLEEQVREGFKATPTPTAEDVAGMLQEGQAYMPEARLETWGDVRFGLHETIVATLVGAASNLNRSAKFAKEAWEKRGFIAEGLLNSLKTMSPRDRKEKKPEIQKEVDAIERGVQESKELYYATVDGIVDSLATLADPNTEEETLYETLANAGKIAANAFEIAEYAALFKYGSPTPRPVKTGGIEGKCVLFSGDDFEALDQLLERAEYNEINVWTRGEALAAHATPHFAKRKRLVGHYGGSWRNQQRELDSFPGSIFVAATPVQEPLETYAPYMFSSVPTRWDSVAALPVKEDGKYDFNAVMRGAKDSSGFFRSRETFVALPVGFGGEEQSKIVDQCARAFRVDSLSKIVFVVGQDFPNDECDYFDRLFQALPDSTLAITVGDARFRYGRNPIPTTRLGLPKILDFGRLRDANAAIRFAQEFGKELDRPGADAPVQFFASVWGELSVSLVFALASKGYPVVVGPKAPQCWNGQIVEALKDRFGVKLAGDPTTDLNAK